MYDGIYVLRVLKSIRLARSHSVRANAVNAPAWRASKSKQSKSRVQVSHHIIEPLVNIKTRQTQQCRLADHARHIENQNSNNMPPSPRSRRALQNNCVDSNGKYSRSRICERTTNARGVKLIITFRIAQSYDLQIRESRFRTPYNDVQRDAYNEQLKIFDH